MAHGAVTWISVVSCPFPWLVSVVKLSGDPVPPVADSWSQDRPWIWCGASLVCLCFMTALQVNPYSDFLQLLHAA